MRKIIDVTGKRFGRLLVLSVGEKDDHDRILARCQCDCGNVVTVNSYNLRKGRTNSCGCLSKEITSERSRKHGGVHTRLYYVWNTIRSRCNNPKVPCYQDYGARGIKMFPGWLNDYGAFQDYILAHLGPKPSDDYSLDRINNDGNYEPGNLRWATKVQQARNSRKFSKTGE